MNECVQLNCNTGVNFTTSSIICYPPEKKNHVNEECDSPQEVHIYNIMIEEDGMIIIV